MTKMMLTKKEFLFEKERLLKLMPEEIYEAQMDLNTYSTYLAPKANKLKKLQLLLEYGKFFGQEEFFGTGEEGECENDANKYLNEYLSQISTYTLNKALVWVTEQFFNLGLYKHLKWLTAAREIANLIHTKKWNEKEKRKLYSYFMIRTPWAYSDYKKINDSEKSIFSDELYLATCLSIKPKDKKDKPSATYDETDFLLNDPVNAKKLSKSIAELDTNINTRDIIGADNSTTLIKMGKEVGIVIPPPILKELNLRNTDIINIESRDGCIVITPIGISSLD